MGNGVPERVLEDQTTEIDIEPDLELRIRIVLSDYYAMPDAVIDDVFKLAFDLKEKR